MIAWSRKRDRRSADLLGSLPRAPGGGAERGLRRWIAVALTRGGCDVALEVVNCPEAPFSIVDRAGARVALSFVRTAGRRSDLRF